MIQFKLATANTLLGKANQNLGSVLDADIILLQEVFSPAKDNFEQQFIKKGFTVAASVGKFGLAILVRPDKFSLDKDFVRKVSFGRLGLYERLLVKFLVRQPHEFTERGMVAIKLIGKNGEKIVVVNVHPSVSFPFKRIRRRQIKKLNQELSDPYYEGALIVGGDMNHYPGPEAVDDELAKKHHLSRVSIGPRSTWKAAGSHYEYLARFQTKISRKNLSDYTAQLDMILYRGKGLGEISTVIKEIPSDHCAIVTTFFLKS